MPRFEEIETKWFANKVSRRLFKRTVAAFLRESGVAHHHIHATGPDVYYTKGDKYIRHRRGSDIHELTTKRRLSSSHITAREEVNLGLPHTVDTKTVAKFLRTIGYAYSFAIQKDFEIYHFTSPNGTDVDIVWYKVHCQGKKPQTFIEVETNAISRSQSLGVLGLWENWIEENLPVGKISKKSLFELYKPKE